MRSPSTLQLNDMAIHMEGPYATLRFAFMGGHRETLVSLEKPRPDDLIVGQTFAGNRIEFHPEDVATITYVVADERVMTPDEIQSYKAGDTTALGPDRPIRVRRRTGRPPKQPDAG